MRIAARRHLPADARRAESALNRTASGLSIPRRIARVLLAIPQPGRQDVLAEVVRVGPGATLTALAALPNRRTAS